MDTLSQLRQELEQEYQTTKSFSKDFLKGKMIMRHMKKT